MREEYTMTTNDNGDARVCPFRLASDSTRCSCQGRRCMAWITQLDDSGKPTRQGRCVMVGGFLQMPVTAYAPWGGDGEQEAGFTLGSPKEFTATFSDEEKYPCDFPKTIDERGREILHCPNCGSIKVSMQRDLGASYVECEECGMRGPVKRAPEPALQEWNSLPRGVLCCGNKNIEE